jgi:3-hydroxybutyryl-CoA dehydrogenase
MTNIQSIAVLGSGTMGSGIAQVAATAGYNVILYDIEVGMLQKALGSIGGFLTRAAEKGRMTPGDAEAAIGRVRTSTVLSDAKDCQVIIEAIPEDLDLKREVFGKLATITPRGTIFATNTSTLSVTRIAAATDFPERVVGMHFFNPAPLLPLVEVIAGAVTDESVVETTMDLARSMGKTPVRVKDVPGFIVNRVARPFYLESLRLLEEGAADHETIDRLLRDGAGFRMGPFELMDLIGLDINYTASLSLYKAYFHEPRYRPSLLQERMVESGRLGRKTGRGWYAYGEKKA